MARKIECLVAQIPVGGRFLVSREKDALRKAGIGIPDDTAVRVVRYSPVSSGLGIGYLHNKKNGGWDNLNVLIS